MIVYIAVDQKNGMMFNHRRQSQDRIMRENMLKDCAGSPLWMNSYSKKLFIPEENALLPPHLVVDDDFLSKAVADTHCFVENCSLTEWKDNIDSIILYKWKKQYPADFYFDTSVFTFDAAAGTVAGKFGIYRIEGTGEHSVGVAVPSFRICHRRSAPCGIEYAEHAEFTPQRDFGAGNR